MAKPLWIISYDIACPKRLRRVQKYCATHAWPMQKSIYLFALNRQEREDMCRKLENLIDKTEDRLLCLPFSTPEGSFHLVPQSPLILVHSDPRLDGFIY